MYRKQGQIERSSALFADAHVNSAQMQQLQLFVQSEVGYNAFLKLEWDEARVHLEGFLKHTTSQGFKAFIGWQLGVCYSMLGRVEDAKNIMAALIPWVRKDYDYDEFAGRRAKIFVRLGDLTHAEKQVTIATLFFEATRFEEAIKLLDESLTKEGLTEDDKGCIYRVKGACYQSLGVFDKAKEQYTLAIGTEKSLQKENVYVIPQSCVGLAEISLKEDKKDQARVYLKKSKRFLRLRLGAVDCNEAEESCPDSG